MNNQQLKPKEVCKLGGAFVSFRHEPRPMGRPLRGPWATPLAKAIVLAGTRSSAQPNPDGLGRVPFVPTPKENPSHQVRNSSRPLSA
jgi:hypothetical protein